MCGARTHCVEAAKSGTGKDVIIASNDKTNAIDAGAGTDGIHLGNANSLGNGAGGADTVCLPTLAKNQMCAITFDKNLGTYTCKRGGNTLAGVKAFRTWDGRIVLALGQHYAVKT